MFIDVYPKKTTFINIQPSPLVQNVKAFERRLDELPALALSEGCHGCLRITEMVSKRHQINILNMVSKDLL